MYQLIIFLLIFFKKESSIMTNVRKQEYELKKNTYFGGINQGSRALYGSVALFC